MNIEQVELAYAQEAEAHHKAILQKLGYSIPEGFRLRVALEQGNRRKKRSSAGATSWAPGSEPMRIWLEPSAATTTKVQPVVPKSQETLSSAHSSPFDASQSSTGSGVYVHPAEAELICALDRAESTPGWSFVSLKKFRDEILLKEDVPSIRSDVERQSVLRSAIDKRLILKKPIPNPKSPQFPVTSIRLNRLMPEVQGVLGQRKSDLDFHPIHIKGEPLSTTVLRERR